MGFAGSVQITRTDPPRVLRRNRMEKYIQTVLTKLGYRFDHEIYIISTSEGSFRPDFSIYADNNTVHLELTQVDRHKPRKMKAMIEAEKAGLDIYLMNGSLFKSFSRIYESGISVMDIYDVIRYTIKPSQLEWLRTDTTEKLWINPEFNILEGFYYSPERI